MECKNVLGRCAIVAAADGRLSREMLEGCSHVIAADAGYKRLAGIGVKPDVLIGDFDSSERPMTDIPTITHPCEKDDTDTGLSAEYAYELGCRDISIYCASGGRPDHEYANYQLLTSLARRGCKAVMYGTDFDIYALHGTPDAPAHLTFEAGYGILSVFCAGEKAEGVTLRGLKYTLEGHTLTCDYALGVSNERTGEEAFIEVKNGTLIVMAEVK